jgi:hypothetical protein
VNQQRLHDEHVADQGFAIDERVAIEGNEIRAVELAATMASR